MEQTESSPIGGKILSAIWQQKARFIYIALVSFVVLFLLGVICKILMPRSDFYSQEIRLFLGQNKDKVLIYPNGKPFNRLDIISAPVLKEVYTRNNLSSLLSYEEFASSLSVVNYSARRAFIDAEFASKLGLRNLNVVNLAELEKEYQSRVDSLDQNNFRISMSLNEKIPVSTALKVLAEIPHVWMEIFQRQEGPALPKGLPVNGLRSSLEEEFQEGPLIATDRAFTYCMQMDSLCNALVRLKQGSRIELANGESLEDIAESLTYIRNYQLNLLLQMLMEDHTQHGMKDRIFLSGRIRSLEQRLSEKRGKLKSIEESIKQLRDPVRPAKNAGAAENVPNDSASASTSASTQLNLDSNFFAQFSNLIQNNALISTRIDLITTFSELGEEIAGLEAELTYYNNLLSGLQKNDSDLKQKVDNQLLKKLFENMLSNMEQAGRQLEEFKTVIMQSTLFAREFYVPVGPVLVRAEYFLPPRKLFLAFGFFWVLIVLCPIAAVAGRIIWREFRFSDDELAKSA